MQRLLPVEIDRRTHGVGHTPVIEVPDQLPRQRPVQRVLLTFASWRRPPQDAGRSND
jgi:hypothetical protein